LGSCTQMKFNLYDSLNNATVLTYNGSTDIWYHVVGTWRSLDGFMELYVNGQLQQTGYRAKPLKSSGAFRIGGYLGGSAACYGSKVTIDEVRIYNRALSDAEIKALYYATK